MPKQSRPQPALVSLTEAGRITGLSRHVLLSLARSGTITSFPLPSGRRMMCRQEMEKLSTGKVDAVKEGE